MTAKAPAIEAGASHSPYPDADFPGADGRTRTDDLVFTKSTAAIRARPPAFDPCICTRKTGVLRPCSSTVIHPFGYKLATVATRASGSVRVAAAGSLAAAWSAGTDQNSSGLGKPQ